MITLASQIRCYLNINNLGPCSYKATNKINSGMYENGGRKNDNDYLSCIQFRGTNQKITERQQLTSFEDSTSYFNMIDITTS